MHLPLNKDVPVLQLPKSSKPFDTDSITSGKSSGSPITSSSILLDLGATNLGRKKKYSKTTCLQQWEIPQISTWLPVIMR